MSALDEYRKYNEYLAAHPTAELEARRYIDLADAAIAELEAKLDTALALAALREGWAKKPEDVLSEVEALTAPLLSRAEKAEAALIYDSYGDMVQTWKSRAVALESARDSERTLRKQAEAENERLLTRYACDVICGMGRRGNGSCSNPYDAECPALPDFIAAAKEEPC